MKQPAFGVRFELVMVGNAGGRACYQGKAHLPGASYALEVTAEVERAVSVVGPPEDGAPELSAAVRAALEKSCAALVRAATRAELLNGEPVPKKIVRWRDIR